MKDLEEFYKIKNGKYGRKSECKICSNIRSNNWKNNNKSKISEYDKNYRMIHKNEIQKKHQEYYSREDVKENKRKWEKERNASQNHEE